MSELPQAEPVPEKPPLHLRGGYLVVAVPEDLREALFALPAVRALRLGRPNATFAVVVPESQRAIWERVERIDHLVVVPDRAGAGEIVEGLRKTGVPFESSFAWSAGPAATAFARLGIQQRLGPDEARLASRLTDPIPVKVDPAPPGHDLRKFLWPLQPLGLETFVPENFPVPELPPRPSPPVIGFAPDSDYGPSHEWPVERFVEVAESLQRETGAGVVVLNLPGAGSQARALAGQLREKLGEGVQDSVDQFALGELLDALPPMSALVCSDNTLAHLAAFVGLPAAVVFGPGDEAARRPQGRMHRIVNAHVECAGCRQAKCPLDHRCMEEVTPGMVLRAVEDILGAG